MTYTLTVTPSIVIRDADGANVPTSAPEYKKWLSAGNTPNPAPAPPLAAQAAAYLAGGLTITSDNSDLNGTYSVLPPDTHNINAIVTSIANGMGLPAWS